MNKFVIDSSVFAKLFINESDSETAIKFFDAILTPDVKIIVPHIFYYEVLNIAVKRTVSLDVVFGVLKDYENTILEYQHISKEVISKAFEIAKNGHEKSGFPSFYDASYHALAIENNCDFITSDEKYINKVHSLEHVVLLSHYVIK